MTSFHCCLSCNAASLHSRMFSHFRRHYKNLWYKPSLTVQSILGPSMYGINMLGTGCGCLGWWNVFSWSGSCSELDSSSRLLICISSGGYRSGSPGRTLCSFRHSGSLFRMIRTLQKIHYYWFPWVSYRQAGNFCSMYWRGLKIFNLAVLYLQ